MIKFIYLYYAILYFQNSSAKNILKLYFLMKNFLFIIILNLLLLILFYLLKTYKQPFNERSLGPNNN